MEIENYNKQDLIDKFEEMQALGMPPEDMMGEEGSGLNNLFNGGFGGMGGMGNMFGGISPS